MISRQVYFSWAWTLVAGILVFSPMTWGYLEYIAARLPLEGTPSPPGTPWPLVQEMHSSDDLVTIDTQANYNYKLNIPACKPIEDAIASRFNYNLLFRDSTEPSPGYPPLSTVNINIPNDPEINECDKFPRLVEQREVGYENYTIRVEIDGDIATAVISANTAWGALHGLETFSHLTFQRKEDLHFYANVTIITDWPRYPHRGMMIDTARHYIMPATIHKILDGMAINKFNVLHWHCVDDQSFPFVSTTFPELSAQGAYHPLYIYPPSTVQEIQEYARVRGIRVILEFDTPGHTQSWAKSHPELLTPCYGDGENPGTPNYPIHAPYEIMDPTRETTFDFLEDFFREIISTVTKDKYIHLGMDEVYPACWNSSPIVKQFMEKEGLTELSQVQQYYTERLLEIIKGLGGSSIVWNDPLDHNVDLDPTQVIIQVWEGSSTGWVEFFQNALEKGYKVLLSSCWYLNYIAYGPTWKDYYSCDPVMNLTDTDIQLRENWEEQILGGEAAIWSEYVDDTNIFPRFFPFVSAVGEKLWSKMNSSTIDDAMWRLDEHRCRMLWRGFPAQPILNGYCDPR